MKTKRISFIFLLYLMPNFLFAQLNYSDAVQAALNQTTNGPELEKALQYFYKKGNDIEIKSINFLIENMPIHSSSNYYWADENSHKIEYNELSYRTFKEAIQAFEVLKKKFGRLHPVAFTYKDIDSITSDLLIENILLALKRNGENAKNMRDEEEFLEYVLPYRASIEPLQNWRKTYSEKFSKLINAQDPLDSQILSIGKNIKGWFTNSYKIENRGEPLPRLGALQLLTRQKGACEDIAGLAAFIARSQGYAAAVDFVPAWATASGVHFLNYINISPKVKHHYDAADGYLLDTLAREPAKVLRTTYSIQHKTIAYQLHNDTSLIPDNFMRLENYKDVTEEYWQTSDVTTHLFKPRSIVPQVAYLNVWNSAKWKPVWFAMLQNTGGAIFSNMCKGVVYLPSYYINGKMIPASWPIINGYNYVKILRPDTLNKTHYSY